MEMLTIGRVARLTDVGVETIRFYERKGLIDQPPRKQTGYRQYPKETIARIRFIRSAKELGFSLTEIMELLSLRIDPDTTCEDIRVLAEARIADIKGKIQSLQRMQKALMRLAETCSGRGPVGECPILEALEE